MGWLNPMTWIKILSLVKSLWDSASLLISWIYRYFTKKKQQEEIKKAQEAVSEIEEANKIEDDNERLKKKAEAACKLEKSLNPNADC